MPHHVIISRKEKLRERMVESARFWSRGQYNLSSRGQYNLSSFKLKPSVDFLIRTNIECVELCLFISNLMLTLLYSSAFTKYANTMASCLMYVQ